MKRLLFTLLIGITSLAYSQAPQKISYQGVARNTSGSVLANQPIGIRFDIHQGSASGAIVFTETHTGVSTNAFGLFTTYIGSISNLSVINWAINSYFIEVSIDPNIGTFSSLGSQQLMSVPYALNAGSAPAPAVSFTNNILSVGGNTATITSGTTYTAGSDISITSGSVITNTAPDQTVTITPAGSASVTGTYPNFTINTPTTQVYTAGNGIGINSSGVISNTAAAVSPTINSGGVANVTNPSTNVYLVDVPAPTINYNSGTNELTLSQNGSVSTATLNGTGSNTVSIVGSGLATVTPTTGSTFTVNVPSQSLTINSNSLSITGGNTITLPTSVITGTGAGISVVTTSANSFTVNTPNPTYTSANGILSFGGTNTVVVAPTLSLTGATLTSGAATNSVNLATLPGLWSASSTTAIVQTNTLTNVGIGLSSPAPQFKLDVAATAGNSVTIHGFNTGATDAFAGVYGENNNNGIGVYAQSNGGKGVFGKSTSGSGVHGESATGDAGKFILSNISTTANAVNAQTNGSGAALYAKSFNANPLAARFDGNAIISHTSSPSAPHINLISPTNLDFGRVKFSNTGSTGYFSLEGRNNTGGAADAFNIAHNNGVNERQVFLINGNRQVFVNNLNFPLATFHVMTSAATATGGIASEGFLQAGQINLIRNNQTATTRIQVNLGEEIGKINFAGFDGSNYGDGAKIYAKATETVTTSNKGTELIFAAVPTGTNTNKDAFKINGLGQLEVISSLRIPGSPAVTAGQVLTAIDALGNASWQTPSAPASPWIQSAGTVTLGVATSSVGIGTSNPQAIFEVATDGSLLNSLHVSNSGSTVGPTIYLDAQSKDWTITGTNAASGAGANKLVFRDYSAGSDRMVIDGTGKVGIGTTNPVAQLTVVEPTQANAAISGSNVSSTANSSAHGIMGLTSNSNALAAAVFGQNSGSGPSIYGVKSPSETGIAGRFELMNTSNTADAVFAKTDGSGAAVHAVSGSTGNTLSNVALWVENGHIKATGANPTITSTITSLQSYTVIGTDVAGKLSVLTSTLTGVPAAQDIIQVTFSKPYSAGSVPTIILTNTSPNSFAVQAYVSGVTNNGFKVRFNTAPNLNTSYSFNYIVIE